MPDDSSASAAGALPLVVGSGAGSGGGGRDRAFSFECFAFGINADEPLPPLEQHPGAPTTTTSGGGDLSSVPASAATRPRGDSIIFDPSSFQDGGIHEQNALCKTHSTSMEQIPSSNTAATGSSTLPKSAGVVATRHAASRHPGNPVVRRASAATAPAAPYGNTSVASATAASQINAGAAFSAASIAPGSIELELLNKGGRIGIYLPEARRARIARFHAKRAKRIWRKRIKYDCRKKLADSRPRIKGRFVKRSDMDE